LDWIEQGLTSPPTQCRLSGRQFYRSKDPTNSIKVLKEKLASHRPEEAPNPPGASHCVTSEPLKKEKPYGPETYTVFRKKHSLMFSFISPWKMFRFTHNFQGMFMRN